MTRINKAVERAYEEGSYTDRQGVTWRRGMDGWFDDNFQGGVLLVRHHDFVGFIESENPEPSWADLARDEEEGKQ
jgi:hypothetical protein